MDNMSILGFILAGITLGMGIAFVFFMLGIRSERNAWTMRAYDGKYRTTPHHCEGEFYYIIPESIFCNEYTRKEK